MLSLIFFLLSLPLVSSLFFSCFPGICTLNCYCQTTYAYCPCHQFNRRCNCGFKQSFPSGQMSSHQHEVMEPYYNHQQPRNLNFRIYTESTTISPPPITILLTSKSTKPKPTNHTNVLMSFNYLFILRFQLITKFIKAFH